MVLKHFERIWQSETIRKRILVTLALVGVYKFLSILPVPGINIGALSAFQEYFRSQPGLAFFSGLLGGGLENFSIVLMGLAPYINATIIMQLLAVIVPKLEMIKKEGEQGQKKINVYTRYLTLPLALAQSYGMIYLMNTLLGGSAQIVDVTDFWGTMLPAMIIVTASTYFLLWLGDIITESGLGNGTSIIIFAGVLAGVPTTILGLINAGNFPLLLLLTALTVAVTYIIILFTE
jgi:preprotein translocase subunit SecY